MSEALPALIASLDARAAALAPAAESVAAVRAAARTAALAQGLPVTRQERWKYTNLRALGARAFTALTGAGTLDPASVAHIAAPRLVLVDGRFDATLSDLSALPAGASVRWLSSLLSTSPEEAAALLAGPGASANEAFQQWNTALADEGLLLEVAAGTTVAPVLQVALVTTAAADGRSLHLRHRVRLGESAALTIVVHEIGADGTRPLLNSHLDVDLAPHATLVEARVQSQSSGATLLHRTQATLTAQSTYRRVDLELGAALSRHELEVSLVGEGASLEANGVLLADGRRHVDTRLGIEHHARDTRCELAWRGFGAERGRAVFHGGILIAEGADGTAAMLSNKNLLVSDSAEIDTQPVLVIHADDVQAAHGATVGRLDDPALFYLRARGVPKAEATAMLTTAFLREPLSVIADPALREALEAALEARLSVGMTA